MTPAPPARTQVRTPTRAIAVDVSDAELAGGLRIEVNRLAYHLRKPATSSGVTPTRLAALAALARHPDGCRAGDLAVEMGVSPASMSRLIDIMTDAEWAERRRDDDDARATILVLTQVGAELLEGLRQESTSWLSAHLDGLGERERAVLSEAVPILRALADAGLESGPRSPEHPRSGGPGA